MGIFRNGNSARNKNRLYKAHTFSCWMRSRGPSSQEHELTLSSELYPCNLCGLANVALLHIHNCFNTLCNIKPNVLAHWIADWLPHDTYSRAGKTFHCLVSNLYYNLSNKQKNLSAVSISRGGLISGICGIRTFRQFCSLFLSSCFENETYDLHFMCGRVL